MLLVDEAGQLALIDAVVASTNADSVLLGDPRNSPRCCCLTLPRRSSSPWSSARRQHHHSSTSAFSSNRPGGCTPTSVNSSDRIYEGRLTSHPHCADRTTDAGTGLGWIQATHEGPSTEAPEEADLIAHQIRQLLKQSWTDKDHTDEAADTGDVLVVALQRPGCSTEKDVLGRSRTRGMRAGTVDRFQGQQP